MRFDASRNAYVDIETNAVIFEETYSDAGVELSDIDIHPIGIAAGGTIAGHDTVKEDGTFHADSGLGLTGLSLEEQLQYMHANEGAFEVSPPHEDAQANRDWNFARNLQFMEFEIENEDIEGFDEHADFRNKEMHSSTCKAQLLTVSFALCIIQIIIMICMIQLGGLASKEANPTIGPPVTVMVAWGAKDAALILYDHEWWRLLTCVMLHAGVWHILSNVIIQARVGGYLNRIYKTPKFLFIYFASGIFGAMQSCIFLPESVGVGSSGALLGILASWIVWIIFRWRKIPEECRAQRNCQLVIVVGAVVVTLATSFSPNVDWAAHMGGALQGILWGVALLADQLDINRNQYRARIGSMVINAVLWIYSLYYIIERLHPDRERLEYWAANDDPAPNR